MNDNDYERVSDILTINKEEFLVLFSVTEHSPALEKPIKHKTLFVNKHYIVWAVPDEDER